MIVIDFFTHSGIMLKNIYIYIYITFYDNEDKKLPGVGEHGFCAEVNK